MYIRHTHTHSLTHIQAGRLIHISAQTSVISCMHMAASTTDVFTLTLLYLLVLVIAGWLRVGILLDVTSGRALRSVGAGYWTVLLAHVTTTGTTLGRHKPAGQSGREKGEEESETSR